MLWGAGTVQPSGDSSPRLLDQEMMGLLFQNNYLCGQKLAPRDCAADPGQCRTMGNTNMYGYPAHFDLQNARLQVSYFLPSTQTLIETTCADDIIQVTGDLGWNNPEVTFEEVSCDLGDFGDWDADCYCPHS